MLKALVALAALALAGCATVFPALPPQDTLVRDVPIHCPGGKLYYLHVYDTDPNGEAFVSVIGPATMDHQHSPPFLVIVGDNSKVLTYYVSSDGGEVQRLTQQEYEARYGDGRLTASVCRLAAERRAEAPEPLRHTR